MLCQNAEVQAKDLAELKYAELRGCDCDRCSPLADTKELDLLRSKVKEHDLKEAALEEGKTLAAEIIATAKETQSELKDIVSDVVKGELDNAGVDLRGPLARVVERKMQFAAPSGGSSISAPSLNTRYGRSQLSPEMKAFVHFARTGEKVYTRKALSEGTNSAGGYLVPEEFRAEVVRKLAAASVMRRAGAQVISTSRDSIDVPVSNADGSGGWIGEGAAYTESDPTFGNVNLTPHKYSRLVKTTTELLEDSAINVADLLVDIFAEDFAAAEDAAFIAGSGTGRPTGLESTTLTAVAYATSIVDSLTALLYALPRQYREKAALFMRQEHIQKLAESKANGVFLWGDLERGEPPRFRGRPIHETNDLTVTAGTPDDASVFVGVPSYYMIADRNQIRLERSAERYFETGHVAFRADMRVDGKVSVTEAWREGTDYPTE